MRALEPLHQSCLEGVLGIHGVELAELGVVEGIELALLKVFLRKASPESSLQPRDLGDMLPAVVLPEAVLERLQAALLLVGRLVLLWRRLIPVGHRKVVRVRGHRSKQLAVVGTEGAHLGPGAGDFGPCVIIRQVSVVLLRAAALLLGDEILDCDGPALAGKVVPGLQLDRALVQVVAARPLTLPEELRGKRHTREHLVERLVGHGAAVEDALVLGA